MLSKITAAVLCACAVMGASAWRHHHPRGPRARHGFMAPPQPHHRTALPDQWLTQSVDHFDAQNQNTWQQRYFVNDQYYTAGGPVFLMLGGEGTANPIWLTDNTQMVNWAQQYGALMFLIEHRYYGNSQPFPDLSTANLQYLSSEQALADAASFHDAMMAKYSLPGGTPWISFGGSYSGALSAWLRLKYPHVVVGAVASSAPVQPELDFSQYLDVVTASLTSMGSSTCVSNIAAATQELAQQLTTANGRAALSTQFQTCSPLTNDANSEDISNFLSSLAGNFEGVVQYNGDNRAFEGAVDTNVTIPVLCALMDAQGVDPLQRYANVNALILQTYGEQCLDFSYADMIAGLANTTLAAGLSGGRQWTYQTCTEFGYYQTSDSQNQPFGSDFGLQFSVQQCADIYGEQFTQQSIANGIQWTATNYGAAAYAGSNVVLPNGSVDPWHYLGVLTDLSPSVNAVFITGTAHCADMYPSGPNDSQALVAARAVVQSHISAWLTEAKAKRAHTRPARVPRTAPAAGRPRHTRK